LPVAQITAALRAGEWYEFAVALIAIHRCFEYRKGDAHEDRNRGLSSRLNAMAPVVHPGRMLKRELTARKLSANRLSLDIGVPSGRITDILNGRRGITADTAVRLGRYFGNSAQFWLDLQGQYDIGVVEREKGAEIARRVRPADAA
jgi:antitoxin HigA-1